jgi:hypothetical protein
MKQRKSTSTTATLKPSIFQQYRQKKGAIDTRQDIHILVRYQNPDDPALVHRSPEYTPDIDIGDRPPTHEICSGRRPSKKKKYLSAIPEQGRRT